MPSSTRRTPRCSVGAGSTAPSTAADAELVAACRLLHGCKTGEAKITRGFRLPAAHVIHTRRPGLARRRQRRSLASCYRRSLALAEQAGAASVAFPAISCGIYGYPLEQAAATAVEEVCRQRPAHMAWRKSSWLPSIARWPSATSACSASGLWPLIPGKLKPRP
ncbi:macro domain-containing protein [Pseudomonas aeruginosa]|nr:macro domain-containing protein [Pseudomonas aeruginosa]